MKGFISDDYINAVCVYSIYQNSNLSRDEFVSFCELFAIKESSLKDVSDFSLKLVRDCINAKDPSAFIVSPEDFAHFMSDLKISRELYRSQLVTKILMKLFRFRDKKQIRVPEDFELNILLEEAEQSGEGMIRVRNFIIQTDGEINDDP